MTGRAVREYVLDRDVDVLDGLRVADLNHPEAVKRMLQGSHRGGDLPLMGCCVEDLEAVRQHMGLNSGDEPTLELRLPFLPEVLPEVRIVPEYSQQQRLQLPRHTRSRDQDTAPAQVEQPSAAATIEQPSAPPTVEQPSAPATVGRHSVPAEFEQEHDVAKLLSVLSLVILIVAIIWQLGLWVVTAAYTSYAADEAAHAASVGGTSAEVRDDALRSVPSWFRTNIDVSKTDVGTVKATTSMPVLTPIFTVDSFDLTSEAPIVSEGS